MNNSKNIEFPIKTRLNEVMDDEDSNIKMMKIQFLMMKKKEKIILKIIIKSNFKFY